MTEQASWHISGEYFENCSCDVVCPCEISPKGFLMAEPDNGYCNVWLVFHVNSGSYGGTDLSGLNIILFARTEGVMAEGNWATAIYLDERASTDQQQAMGAIFGGQAGGPMAALAPLIGSSLGIKTVPIEYRSEGKKRSAVIPGILNSTIEAVPSPFEGEVVVKRNANPLFPGEDWVQAYGVESSYRDYDWSWDNSGKCADYANFSFAGP